MKGNMIVRWGVSIVLCMVGVLGFAMVPVAFAQETTGGIKAYVKDKTGAAVPKAKVVLSGPALFAPRELEADDAGYAYFAQVPPGEYSLSATALNFRTYRVTGIKLDVGKALTFDLALEIGEVTQTIEVTSTASRRLSGGRMPGAVFPPRIALTALEPLERRCADLARCRVGHGMRRERDVSIPRYVKLPSIRW